MSEEKLVALLYTLMRDFLPVGTLTEAVNELSEVPDGTRLTFSNRHLEAFARELTERLR